jgi:hypothetical protein
MRKLSAKKSPIKRPKLRGVILYDGPSMLDGEPIVVIATLETSNRKTGQMVQTVSMGQLVQKGHKVSLTSLRGSAALEQLSDVCIGLERDQQSEDQGDIAQIRLLKNRPFGQVGPAGHLKYDVPTGRMNHYDLQDTRSEEEQVDWVGVDI